MNSANKILVIGDALEDIYYICDKPTRTSAEVQIPINDVKLVQFHPGGAANIARSLENLGFEVDRLYGWNGNLGVPQKCRIYADGVQVARFDLNDRVEPIYKEFLDSKMTNSYCAVVVADYGKGSVDASVRDRVIDYCQKFVCPMFVHTKSNPSLWWTAENELTYLFCNASEWERFAEQYNVFSKVIRTDGENGVMFITKGKVVSDQPALAPRVVDVNGAGDVFMATYIARTVGTSLVVKHLPTALGFASVASAIAIQRPYTSYIEFQELKEGWYEYNNSKSYAS